MSQAQRRPLIFKKRSLATKLSLRRRNQQLLAKSNSPCSASSVSEEERNPVDMSQSPGVPELFTRRPVCRDKVRTQTCEDEDRVVASCLPFLNGRAFLRYGPDFLTVSGVPHLLRDRHKLFLEDSLEAYPPPFKSMDASRPWMLYWNLTALPLIGEDSSPYRRRAAATLSTMQNPSGGFGGGHGQLSHAASAYAAVLTMASCGDEECFKIVDRKAFWLWIGELKQVDGGFSVTVDGEEDVRGTYCILCAMALLALPLESPPDSRARRHGFEKLTDGVPEYIVRCQTYEGGISGSPGTEAHGALTFCALAALCILGEPREMFNRYLDVPSLISWLSSLQLAPEGGFCGRTNKLVDGCYSHWVGGSWVLLQAALDGPLPDGPTSPQAPLFHQEGLTRYIMSCCQQKKGGFVDKPGKFVDAYHTCYNLMGLSHVQYYHFTQGMASSPFDDTSMGAGFAWSCVPLTKADSRGDDAVIFEENERLQPIHPVFLVSHSAATKMRQWFEGRGAWV